MVAGGRVGPPSMRIECLGLRLRRAVFGEESGGEAGGFTALPFRQRGVVHRKGPPDPRGPPTEACWLLMPSGTLADPMGHERTGEAHDQNARSYDADQVN